MNHFSPPRAILSRPDADWPTNILRNHPGRLPANDGTAEQQYLELVANTLVHGVQRSDRTGTGTRSLHGATLRFDCSDGSLPLPTTKKLRWKAVAHELLWFLSGDTNIRPLLVNNIHIWTDWPLQRYRQVTQENLDRTTFEERVLHDPAFAEKWGSIGPGYGAQWRAWEGPDGKRYDQVSDVIRMIKATPDSRRLLWHGWNVAQIEHMKLPPCHLLYQFFVADGRLSLTMYQRSCDMGLGVPYNLVSCAILLRLVAEQCDLEPGGLFWVGHDVHVYNNHEDGLRLQLSRIPRAAPKLILTGDKPQDLFANSVDRMKVIGYKPDSAIHLPVAV
jgi:thymidylate synthase